MKPKSKICQIIIVCFSIKNICDANCCVRDRYFSAAIFAAFALVLRVCAVHHPLGELGPLDDEGEYGLADAAGQCNDRNINIPDFYYIQSTTPQFSPP